MQRVRIGIIGLASVFLLTMLATALYSLLGADTPPGAPVAAASSGAAGNVAAPPREPLAELGVAPGNVPAAANSATPATPKARPVPSANR